MSNFPGSPEAIVHTLSEAHNLKGIIGVELSQPVQKNDEYSPTGQEPFVEHWRRLRANPKTRMKVQ